MTWCVEPEYHILTIEAPIGVIAAHPVAYREWLAATLGTSLC
ncbi:hypothetical protein CZ787_03825 [Halomonas citrativorans]|uniref:Uncharacterized protein n=1 Tax=Halomonas citrativorans TaxID=2742612 RepID=A0A1R4HSG8_9GAMM|nr:hypothetical protein CZ787_03825 [Halomonas citrativorans]